MTLKKHKKKRKNYYKMRRKCMKMKKKNATESRKRFFPNPRSGLPQTVFNISRALTLFELEFNSGSNGVIVSF